uniref:sperm head and tail associated protein-like n=1 Tax=Arvicanthis niloticus TaxID=61156 RepID=UPI001485EBF9|nr:sperm head and tail associated protein-like [Arvicanthis niloticus]
MTSSPPFLLKISAPATSPQADCPNNYSFPPESPSSCRKGFTPVLTVEVPVASGKEFNDHLSCTAGLSPNAGNRFTNPPYSREPFSCLTISSPCLPRRIPTPPPPPPVLSSPPPPERSSFEPFSPLIGRLYSQEPGGSSPPSPCFDRLSLQGSPAAHQRNPYCNFIGSPESQRSCPPSPRLCYVSSPPLIHQPPRASPVTSPQLTHITLETGPVISTPLMPGSQRNCPIISPLLTHRPLRTGVTISPPLPPRSVETRPPTSPSISHRVLETGSVMSPWSSGRSYNDPPLSSASSPSSGNPYNDHPTRPDSCELKPQLDVSLGKNGCGPPLSSQAGVSGSPISPQEGCIHYSHLCPDSQISAPKSPYCVINLPPAGAGSPSSSLPQALQKPCIGSFLWEPGGNSYLLLTPGAVISGPTEPLPQCPSLYFPSPLDNQCLAPPRSPRGYKEPCLPTPAPSKMKSPKSSESRRTPYKCRSLVNTPHHTPNHPKSHKTNTCPQPPPQPVGLSSPLMEPSITTTSNSGPKELPPETPVLKTVAPTSCPHTLPCNPALPSRYPKSSPHGPPPVSPCNTHMYSVVPPTSHLSPLSSPLNQSVHLPYNQPVVLPCGTYSAPRGPPLPHGKPVVPPCSTHIYSFIPLRTPFDPRCLPVVPRARFCPTTIPCGVHTYAVTNSGPLNNPSQIPYSCSLPPSQTPSTCSTSASSTIVCSDYQSSDGQSNHQNRSQSQNKSSSVGNQNKNPLRRGTFQSRSRSQSSSPPRSSTQDQSESTHMSASHHKRSRNQSKSPPDGIIESQSKSPQHRKSLGQIKSSHSKKK